MKRKNMSIARGLIGGSMLFVLVVLAACGGGGSGNGGGEPASTATVITAQPTDQSVVAETSATFTVVASNATGYQWQRSTDGGTTFADVAGAASASHTTAATTLADSGTQYRVVVSGAGNGVTSSAVTLTVTPIPVAPGISVHPTGQTITAGQDASFSVTAGGTTLSYQWQRSTDGGANFADIAGATNATLTLTAVPLADNGHRFHVVVSNSAGSVTSSAALLTVNAAPSTPAFTTHPGGTSVLTPDTATFTVAVTGNPGPTLQWQLSTNAGGSFADIAGATASSYTTPATSAGDNGNQYRVIASNASGSATSNVATLTVAVPAAPGFILHPVNVTITEGQNARFTVAVSGTPTPTLQWQLSTDSGGNWSNITGATGTVLDLIGVALANDGRQFRAVATNSAGTTNSNAAMLTVAAAPPAGRIVYTHSYDTSSDVMLVREDGTGGIVLAGTPDYELFLAVAPGGRVIYQRTTGGQVDLYSVLADGTGTVALAASTDTETYAGMTPAGKVIYQRYTATAGLDLYAVNADGTGAVVLSSTPSHDSFAGVTPSGKVLFSFSLAGQYSLGSINADGTGSTTLWADAIYLPGYLAAAPGGDLIFGALSSSILGSFYRVSENGGTPAVLATNTVPFAYEYRFGGLTASGQAVFNWKTPAGDRDVVSGGIALAATADDEWFVGATASGRVVYQKVVASGDGNSDLYAVNLDGTGTAALANSADYEIFNSILPDGRILYARGVSTDGGNLYSVAADGSGTAALANTSDYEVFKGVTANGRVVYERTQGSTTYVYAVNADGTGMTPLANTGGHAFFAGTTPSGKVLLRRFSTFLNTTDIYIVNDNGTGLMPLANSGDNETSGAVLP
jgi:Tol biopolymer transport system component